MEYELTAPTTIKLSNKKVKEHKMTDKIKRSYKIAKINVEKVWRVLSLASMIMLAAFTLQNAEATATRFGSFKLMFIPAGIVLLYVFIRVYKNEPEEEK